MTLLAFSSQQERAAEQRTLFQDPSAQPFDPGWFGGDFGIVGGIGSAVAGTNYAAGLAVNAFASYPAYKLDEVLGTDLYGWLQSETEEARMAAARAAPDPAVTGAAGRIVHSVLGVGIPTAVAGFTTGPIGAAVVAGAVSGGGEFATQVEQGVDRETAAQAGFVTGALGAVGAGLPASFGASLWKNIALYGPGINVAQGLIQQQAVGEILEQGGYKAMAEQYRQITAESVIADALLGAVFGGIGARYTRQAEIDAAMVAQDRAHAAVHATPGIPKTPEAANAHAQALVQATEALTEGRAVTATVDASQFEARAKPRLVYRDGKWEVAPDRPFTIADEAATLRTVFESAGLRDLVREVDTLQRQIEARGLADARETDALAAPDDDGARIGGRPAEDGADLPGLQESTPEVIAGRTPDMMIPTEDGVVRAADALESVKRDAEAVKEESTAVDVAVKCFLRGGA